MAVRLFFAIPLPEPVLDAISEATRPLRTVAGISWSRRANLHITLRFLGNVEESAVPALIDAVTPWVRLLPLGTVVLAGGGAFPDAHHPRVLWLGLRGAEPLAAMARAIDGAIQHLGPSPEELPFRPHITVGRVREGRQDRVAAALLEFGELASFTPDSVVLYRSDSTPDGFRYSVVSRINSPARSKDLGPDAKDYK